MKKAIFTCGNGSTKWLSYARVTIQSILEHNDCDIDIFLFTNTRGFNGINTADIHIDGAKVVSINADIADYNKGLYVEDSICIRLKAFEYLADRGYDMAAYMDADAIMLKPFPAEFWNGRNGMVDDAIMKAVFGKIKDISRVTDPVKKLVYAESYYFNSGFMRADLHDPVWKGLFDRYLEYRTRPDVGTLLDQEFLNLQILNHSSFELLSAAYNFAGWHDEVCTSDNRWTCKRFEQSHGPAVMHKTIENAYVLHYAAAKKPWHTLNIDKLYGQNGLGIFWYEQAIRTPEVDVDIVEKAKENRERYIQHILPMTVHDVKPLPLPAVITKKLPIVGPDLSSLFEI